MSEYKTIASGKGWEVKASGDLVIYRDELLGNRQRITSIGDAVGIDNIDDESLLKLKGYFDYLSPA